MHKIMNSILQKTPEDIVAESKEVNLFESRKFLASTYRHGKIPSEILPKMRRTAYNHLIANYEFKTLEKIEVQESAIDTFRKYAFKSYDGFIVESVRIPLENKERFVVCVSSQSGCAMKCAFCGTAKLGLIRNLEAWEIVDQIRQIKAELPKGTRIHGVVFQGMGEPLANVDNVLQSIKLIMEPTCLSIDCRNITISTCGLANKLERVLTEAPNVRIGISIGSAIKEKREKLIPIEKSQKLEDVIVILAKYAMATKISPMFAYTTLKNVNDTEEDFKALNLLINKFVELSNGIKPRISLINYNRLGENDTLEPVSDERFHEIRNIIASFNVPVIKRYSGGRDIEAACGQLGIKYSKENQ